MGQRRKLRTMAAAAIAAAVLSVPAVAGAAPWETEWRDFSSLEEFESACSAMHGTPDLFAGKWDLQRIYCRTRWVIWNTWPMGWEGPDAHRALLARYGPPPKASHRECPGCGGGGSW